MKDNLKPQHYILLCICLGIFVTYLSNNFIERWKERPKVVARELALLRGGVDDPLVSVYPELHNRVLFAFALGQASRLTFFTPSRWYGGLRIISAVLMFLVLWRALAAFGASDEQVLLGIGLLTYCVICSFEIKYEYPSDFLDPLFMTLIVRYALQRKHAALVAVTLLGCFNRESAVFAGVIWLCLYGYRKRLIPRELAFGFGLAAGAYALVLTTRWLLAGGEAFRQVQSFTVFYNLWFFKSLWLYPHSIYSWLTVQSLLFGMMLLFLWTQRAKWDDVRRRLLLAALLITGATVTLATVVEVRIMLPTAALLVWVVAATWRTPLTLGRAEKPS